MKSRKGYGFQACRSFASRWNVLGLHLVMPLCTTAVCLGSCWVYCFIMEGKGDLGHLAAGSWCGVMVFLEICMDWLAFGGICSREDVGLDYVRTSPWAGKFLKRAFCVDAAWRLCRILCSGFLSILLGGMLLGGGKDVYMGFSGKVLADLLLAYAVSMAGVLAARHCSILFLSMLCGSAGILVYGILWSAVFALEVCLPGKDWVPWALCGALAALGAGISALGVRQEMRKVGRGYYDSWD